MTRHLPDREMPNFDFGFDFDGTEDRSRDFIDSMKSKETNRRRDLCIRKLRE